MALTRHCQENFPNAFRAAFAGGKEVVVLLFTARGYYDLVSVDEVLAEATALGFDFVVQQVFKQHDCLPEGLENDSSLDRLETALVKGNTRLAKIWMQRVQRNGDINMVGGYFGNALQAAAFGGHVDCVDLVIKAGGFPHAVGLYGSALRAASLNGHDEVIGRLLKEGASDKGPYQRVYVGERSTKSYALTAACLNNHYSSVKLMLDTLNKDGQEDDLYQEALLTACSKGNDLIASLIMDWYGPQKYGQIENEALKSAVFAGRLPIIQLFLDRFEHMVPLSEISIIPCSIPSGPNLLPRSGRDARSSGDDSKKTLLPRRNSKDKSHLENLDELYFSIMGRGIELNDGGGLLRAAARQGDASLISALIARGASADGSEDCEYPASKPRPIEVAAAYGNDQAVEAFSNGGAELKRALCYAVRFGQGAVVKSILRMRPDVEVDLDNFHSIYAEAKDADVSYAVYGSDNCRKRRDLANHSALALALELGVDDMFAILLEHKASVSIHHMPNLALAAAAKNNETHLRLLLEDARLWEQSNSPLLTSAWAWAASEAVAMRRWNSLQILRHSGIAAPFIHELALECVQEAVRFCREDLAEVIACFSPKGQAKNEAFCLTKEALVEALRQPRQRSDSDGENSLDKTIKYLFGQLINIREDLPNNLFDDALAELTCKAIENDQMRIAQQFLSNA